MSEAGTAPRSIQDHIAAWLRDLAAVRRAR